MTTLKAFDLTKISPHFLRMGYPLSAWPTIDINVDDVKNKTCIASWRWDVDSLKQTSDRLSECAWDGIHMNFYYLLCDIVAIPQESIHKIQLLKTFSELYESLHAVIAYDTDPEMRRTWLKNEAIRILKSPTKLSYAYHKWKLRIPLIPSLTIRQICTRRLGLQDINVELLPLCDDPNAGELCLKELKLIKKDHRVLTSINIDRRAQKYASDILLVYELSLEYPRPLLIDKLSSIKSNSIIMPVLTIIWAFIEGLSISIRGCDWDTMVIIDWVNKVISDSSSKMSNVFYQKNADSYTYNMQGGLQGNFLIELVSMPYILAPGFKDIFVRCHGKQAHVKSPGTSSQFLLCCLDYAEQLLSNHLIDEPDPLTSDSPQYELSFDKYDHHDTTGMR